MIPIADYRFGDRHYVTSFVTPKNPDIQDILHSFGNVKGDNFVDKVAAYICDNYQYPLAGNMPSCDGQLLRYTEGLFQHKFKCCKFYVWAFPAETIQSHFGYCAETGNLAESILVNKVDAWAVLGDVLDLNGSLLGRHEWCEVPYKGNTYVLETTIHTKDANNLATVDSVYNKESDWAKQGGLYYSPQARFNNKRYTGDNVFVAMMGLPAKRILLFGLEKTQKVKAKQLYKELRREDIILNKLLQIAWGGK